MVVLIPCVFLLALAMIAFGLIRFAQIKIPLNDIFRRRLFIIIPITGLYVIATLLVAWATWNLFHLPVVTPSQPSPGQVISPSAWRVDADLRQLRIDFAIWIFIAAAVALRVAWALRNAQCRDARLRQKLIDQGQDPDSAHNLSA
jgi:hypothetical protein